MQPPHMEAHYILYPYEVFIGLGIIICRNILQGEVCFQTGRLCIGSLFLVT